ncbi:MAG TPA: M13 family metallopeptidase [Holophagaceae bacterium]|nr:M13 family metallopeptidase [Holophagaceae bacterium]
MNRLKSLSLALGLVATALVAGVPADTVAPVKHGIDPANMDTSVKPCDDFYDYANGGWLKRTEMPADKSRFGAFNELIDHNRGILHDILVDTSAKKDWKRGSIEQKVGDYYAAAMDEAAIEKLGAKPVQGDLALAASLKSGEDLPAVLAKLHDRGFGGGFRFGVGQDDKDSTKYISGFNQAGLGMPDRDYYLKDDERSKKVRVAYEEHVGRTFQLLGDKTDASKDEADVVMKVETALAKASWTRVENRDPIKTYNKLTLAQLAEKAPGFDWKAYVSARGVKASEVLVSQPSFFTAFAKLAGEITPAEWRTYLRWHVINGASSLLSKPFQDEAFSFTKAMTGVEVQEDRWKRMTSATDGALGEALGQLYVKKAFSPEAKQKVLDMVHNMQGVLRDDIGQLPWMDAPTKAAAVQKLDAFMIKMGYPDKWKEYKFEVKRDDYYGNVRRAAAFRIEDNLRKLGKPVDRAEWGMTPATVNAYYNPSMNEVVFPAGILQAPFFDPKADDAVNYGGIGVVIGHEMTHGFDDQGCQYDADGNLKNWWSDSVKKAYDERTGQVVKEFDGFEPIPGEHINGKLTLGENIADLGGLKIAYLAWKRSLKGQDSPVIDGFTGDQRFFLGFATVWREHARPQYASMALKVDPHSPGKFRVMGPLANMPEFYKAFGVDEGCKMFRPEADRPSIW